MGALLAGYLLLLVVANFEPVQRWLAGVAASALADKLDTDVHIGRVEIGLFNRVILHDVCVKDRAGENLLCSDLVSAKIEYRALAEGRVSLRSVSLLDGRLHLYRTKADTAANYQFVLDAFRSEKQGPSTLNLSLNSLIIRRTEVGYDERWKAVRPGVFDASHVGISDLDANISLKTLTPDSINLRVRQFAFRERSGFRVKELSFRLAANRSQCAVSQFRLVLPGSKFTEDQLFATYHFTDGREFAKTIRLRGSVRNARVALADVACFVPALRQSPYAVDVSASFNVRPEQITIPSLHVRESRGRLTLWGNAKMLRRDGKVVRGECNVDELIVAEGFAPKVLQGKISDKALALIARLGEVRLHADAVTEEGKGGVANAGLKTAAGSATASLHFKDGRYALTLSTPDLSPATLFADAGLPSAVAFDADATAEVSDKKITAGTLALNLDNLVYRDAVHGALSLTADYANGRVKGRLSSTDADMDLTADADACFDGRSVTCLNTTADIRRLNASLLGRSGRFARAVYAGKIKAELPSLSKERLSGHVVLDDFAMQSLTDADASYTLDHLDLQLTPAAGGTHALLDSDFAHADVTGRLVGNDVAGAVKSLAYSALPGLAPTGYRGNRSGKAKTAADDRALCTFNVTLLRPDFFQNFLGVNLDFDSPVDVSGYVAPAGRRSSLTASSSRLQYGGFALKDFRAYLQDDGTDFSGLVQGVKRVGQLDIKTEVRLTTDHGRLMANVSWDDGGSHRYTGGIETVTDFARTLQGGTSVSTAFAPTTINMADTTWTVSPSHVTWADGRLNVQGFRLSHDDRWLGIDGELTGNRSDSLLVKLRGIDVSYILDMVNLKPVRFDGLADGLATVKPAAGGGIRIDSRLSIPDFHFNGALMGDADISLSFASSDKTLRIGADMREEGVGRTQVDGYVNIGGKALSLDVESRNTTLQFLRRYLPDVFADVTGRTTGHCRIYGPFKSLDFEGSERADLYARVTPIGCAYHLSGGHVDITSGTFRFADYKVEADEGGTGTLSGTLLHDHLKNLRYDIDARTNRLLIYNKGKSPDLPFYATAYGTGTARLYGRPGSFTADIDMRPDAGTLFVYTVSDADSGSDPGLLRFGVKTDGEGRSLLTALTGLDKAKENAAAKPAPQPSQTDINLNFQLDMTPDAALRVITDEKTGDNITLRGHGALRATFFNKGAFQMYGGYTVDRGLYKMVIQEVVHKDFQIRSGGTINFAGDPYEGNLNLQAVYTVPSASLADLGFNFSDKSVRADCELNLGGKVKAPQVTFGLSLPGAGEEVRQMVRQLIATDEDMNMQILYLLGVGRFYNYNFAATEAAGGGQAQSSVAMKSFLAGTLSGQLNNLISNAVGASNWTFGANLSTGQVGWSDMEVGGALSGRLFNNRLLVNGVVGYRERSTSTNNFVGDFDISYLLTPSGSVRLKAYSETNDRYFSKSSLTTQGIGVLLQRDFTSIANLFRTRRKPSQETTPDTLTGKQPSE